MKYIQLFILLLLLAPLLSVAQSIRGRTQTAEAQITELKNGALLFRLNKKQMLVNALKERNMTLSAAEVEADQLKLNTTIIKAFRNQFKFCPVYFFYNTESDKVEKGDFKNVFLNDSGLPDSTIQFAGTNYLTAEYSFLESGETGDITHKKYDTVTSILKYKTISGMDSFSLERKIVPASSPNEANGDFVHYQQQDYNGYDMEMYAFIIKDHHYHQLSSPFPYSVRMRIGLTGKLLKVQKYVAKLDRMLTAYYGQTHPGKQ